MRTRLNFLNLNLFEDEEWGSTQIALYVNITDSLNNLVGQFKWNNRGMEVDEVKLYNLDNDNSNPNVIDLDLNSFATVTIQAFTHDDDKWPSAANFENNLGSASVTIDPVVPSTLGNIKIGPTQTDNNNTGYEVNLIASLVNDSVQRDARIQFDTLVLYEDEEAGDTQMAIYVSANGPGIDNQEIFRWNNGGNKVNETNSYPLNNSGSATVVNLTLAGPTQIWVAGYTDDDISWPSAGQNENFLGSAMITIDPSDPSTLGKKQLGPTLTDNENTGYVVNLSIDLLPGKNDQPSLSIIGVEITQAIQYFQSSLGGDNTAPLVENKETLVRVYIDSGLNPAINNGEVPNVTGSLTLNGSTNATLNPIGLFTAKLISNVDASVFTDTLNFIIPASMCNGLLNLIVQASVGASVSNPTSSSISFRKVNKRQILMVRIQSGAIGAPSITDYIIAVNRLPLIYPLPTDAANAIAFFVSPGSQVINNTHNLNTEDGMSDLLDDVDDIQDEFDSSFKAFGMVSNTVSMKRFGTSTDCSAIGWNFIMESIGHELGHLYGLDHAPCGTPGNYPDNTDDDFVPPNGSIGNTGVDVVGRAAFSSATSDFMSYCGNGVPPYENQWIGTYHWKKLFNEFKI
jgi:hypothetical protein